MDKMYLVLMIGLGALFFAGFSTYYVMRQSEGSKKVKEISEAIKEGALAFLHREYKILAGFIAIIFIILVAVPDLGWEMGVAFLFGAICSMVAGYAGMNMAIRANSRTTTAVQQSLNQGLRVSFRSGTVMGMAVVGLGIVGMSILYFAFHDYTSGDVNFISIIPAYGFGASAVALFSRVGGGIYTKGADMGADLVGKVEKGIPEDDPRNAAVIADFVGDNVGDVAGMGADLFESYVESIIATMTLWSIIVVFTPNISQETAWHLPMLVAAGGIVASIIGALLVKVGETVEMQSLLNALRRGTFVAAGLSAAFAALIVWWLAADWGILWAIFIGLAAGILIGESTTYFTSYSYKPTKDIASAAQTGSATIVVKGLSTGFLSVVPPMVLVAFGVALANHFAGIYGVAIAGVGMLSTLGITLATDAYGPVADNAGGIAEMSKLPAKVRERTDALDSLGNTTAATGKGFAIGSAGLTALALTLSYCVAVGIVNVDLIASEMTIVRPEELSLLSAPIIAGLFIGVMLPAVFCALTLNSVGNTTGSIVNEVRRQFKEITGLWEGTARPEYSKCVDICTKQALKEMILPALLAIVVPVVVGLLLGKYALAGLLMGSTVSGFMLAVTLANAGGAWDNAKKWIEVGNFGGKGSEAHKAGVVGDTVGDPMKDTSGPALNIMIKLMAVMSLVLAPVFTHFDGLAIFK